MSESDVEQPIRDEQGRFLPGNPLWQLYAFARGERLTGRRPHVTPTELAERIAIYAQDQIAAERPLTVAGMALAVGISRARLYEYRQGAVGEDDETRRAYRDVMTRAWELLAQQGEAGLLRSSGQTAGVMRWLQNIDRAGPDGQGWRDEKHMSIENNEIHTLRIIADPDSSLAQRLQQAGSAQLIEHQDEGEGDVSD